MFDNINVIMTPADAFNTFTIHWPLFRLQSKEGRIICSLNELTSTNNAGHEDFMHAALGEWERDGAGVDGETRTLVHLLEGHFLSMLQEPGRNSDETQSQSRRMYKSSIRMSFNEHRAKLSSYFCLTMSKHLSMLALVPSMLHTLISPWGAEACCRLFLPRLPFAPFFGFNPSVSWEQNMKEISRQLGI